MDTLSTIAQTGLSAVEAGSGPFLVALGPHTAGKVAAAATRLFTEDSLVNSSVYYAAFVATVYGVSTLTAVPLTTVIAIQALVFTALWVTGPFSSNKDQVISKEDHNKLRKSNFALKASQKSLTSQNTKLMNNARDMQGALEEKEALLTLRSKEYAQLEDDMKNLKADLDNLQAERENKDETIENLNDDLQKLLTKLKDKEDLETASKEEIQTLKEQVESLRRDLDQEKKDKAGIEQQLIEVKEINDQLTTKLNELEQQHKDDQANIKQLLKIKASLEKSMKALDEQTDKLDDLGQQLTEEKEINDQLAEKLKKMEQQHEDDQAKINSLSKEKKSLEKQINKPEASQKKKTRPKKVGFDKPESDTENEEIELVPENGELATT